MAGENIRGFLKFFTNLTPSQKAEIERVLNDLQNSKELMSLDTSLRQLRRKPDQLLPIPQLVTRATVRGAIIEWEPLTDQRINFYEVDISDTSNFASFNTVSTYGISIVIDGLTSSKTVRVRGVRRDGTTTPYSESITVNPELFDIQSHTAEAFYVPIEGTDPVTILGGAGTDLDYTPINPDGNSKVWGFVSTFGDPAVAMFGLDNIVIKLIKTVFDTDGVTPVETEVVWQLSVGEFNNSQSIGPFHISHPELNQSIVLTLTAQDTTTKEDGTARTQDSSEVWWAHLSVLEIGST